MPLTNYYDGRFARHQRFPYFILNTHSRIQANNAARFFVHDHNASEPKTIGDLRDLSKDKKSEIFRQLQNRGHNLTNSTPFWAKRRRELFAMCEQLGAPHVFATTSHADSFCPYRARFIGTWLSIPDDDQRSPFAPGLSDPQQHARRSRLMRENPVLTAEFFHRKTELFLQHIARGVLGAQAHWLRYALLM